MRHVQNVKRAQLDALMQEIHDLQVLSNKQEMIIALLEMRHSESVKEISAAVERVDQLIVEWMGGK